MDRQWSRAALEATPVLLMTSSVEQTITFVVDEGGERLDRYLAGMLPDVSRAEVQRWIKEARVVVDGRPAKSSHRLARGESVIVRRPMADETRIEPESIDLDVVFEDDELLVVNKPAGMVVHPAPGHTSGTLVNALLGRYPELAENGAPERAGIVHRLDRDTSGLLVVAKTTSAHRALQSQFKGRVVKKTYLALVEGLVEVPQGQIEAPIGRSPVHRKQMAVLSQRRGGRSAATAFRVLGYYEPKVSAQRLIFTLLEVDLLTGRTHQVRVHLAFLGHPVVGDRTYGRRKQRMRCPRQFLHAARLQFLQPTTGATIAVEAPLPEDLQDVLDGLDEVR